MDMRTQQRKPTKLAIEQMKEQVLTDLAFVRSCVDAEAGEDSADEAMASLETFVAVALRLIAKSNASKVADIMRTVEIAARMDGKVVYE
jgi:hypothetical protein